MTPFKGKATCDSEPAEEKKEEKEEKQECI